MSWRSLSSELVMTISCGFYGEIYTYFPIIKVIVTLNAIIRGANDGFTPREKTFMKDNWSAAAYADYVRAPLENCWALNEERFCGKDEDGGLGLDIYDLLQLPNQLVPYGGLRGIGVQPGERVIIAPATGMFTGAAVAVADAMGANVIAVGRNIQVLKELQATFRRIKIVQLKGNIEKDTAAMKAFGPVDAYIDISPPTAVNSTHLRSAFMALEPYGRVSLMGIPANDSIPVPYAIATFSSLTIRGQFMYEPSDVPAFIKLAESGLLKLGKEGGVQIVGKFGLDEVEKAFATASANPEAGRLCMVVP